MRLASARPETSLLYAGAALILTVVLVACSSSGPRALASTTVPTAAASTSGPPAASTSAPTAAQPTTPPLGAPLSGDLIGTWTSNISDADVSIIQQHAPDFDAKGTWTAQLSATTFQFRNPHGYSPGSYPVGLSPRTEIILAPELDCPDQTTQDGGLYTYKIVGTSLTLTLVRADSCQFRQGLLTAHPWQKSG